MAQTPGPLLWEETVPGGCHWSGVVRRGVALRLTDLEGGANCSMLIFNHEERTERYNMPDHPQGAAHRGARQGHVLYTDMGRALCSIVEDTVGGHDTVCGVMDDATLAARFGERRYQQARNDMYRSGKEGLLKELGRVGLASATCTAASTGSAGGGGRGGQSALRPRHSRAGGLVDLRFDMHAFVALSTCMHPLDPQASWSPKPVKVSAWRCGPAGPDDYCRNLRPRASGLSSTPSATSPNSHDEPQLVESRLDPKDAVLDEICPAGEPWMRAIRKGQVLRILDLEGNQAVDTLFYSLHDPEERYSAVDTIQRQGNLYLGAGTQLISTEGNPMLTIVADTCGRHDTLGGACAQESNTVRYALDKRYMHACRDNFVSACTHHHEYGLGKRDITHNINFFMNVPVTPRASSPSRTASPRRASTSSCAPRWTWCA